MNTNMELLREIVALFEQENLTVAAIAARTGQPMEFVWTTLMVDLPRERTSNPEWPLDALTTPESTTALREATVEPEEGEAWDDIIDPDDLPRGKWIFDEGYTYNGDTDTYVFFLRCHPNAPYPVSGGTVKDIIRAYSNYAGKGATVDQIAVAHALPRQYIVEILRKLGKTHTSDPRTPEEMETLDVDEMIEEDVHIKRSRYVTKLQQADWRATKKDADLYRKGEYVHQRRLQEMAQAAEAIVAKRKPEPLDLSGYVSNGEGAYLLDLSLSDLHYGKLAVEGLSGSEYNRKIARDYALEATRKLVGKAVTFGVDRILFELGNDLFHVDNKNNGTSRDTPQDVDGHSLTLFQEVLDLSIELIDMLAQVAPVDVLIVPGNHDMERCMYLGVALDRIYGDSELVTVDASLKLRKYYLYGSTLLGKTHGDGPKDNTLPRIMAVEAPEMWAKARFREVHVSHLHMKEYKEFPIHSEYSGVRLRRKPSLSGTDFWHYGKGYGSLQAAEANLYHKEDGFAACLSVLV